MRAAFFFALITLSIQLQAQDADTPYVILISFDGFRHDYVKLFQPPQFAKFIEKGSQSKGLIPSFPSKTFPNHYSIVTGLYPGHHGIVDNSFYDPSRKLFYGMSMKERVRDQLFYKGKPIWQLAHEHNIKSASYFWVGSEVPENHPDYFVLYDETVADTARVDQVLKWLLLPSQQRPHFISLYFSSPDHEGHLYGPEAEETRRAVLHADSSLMRLMDGLQRFPFRANVILVSDHGMRALKQEQSSYIVLDEILNLNDKTITVSNGGTQAHIYLRDPSGRDSLQTLLRSKARHFSVLNQEQFPARWHYKSPRSGDLLMVADDGYYIREHKFSENTPTRAAWFGVHGYDPSIVKDMQGIFYAQGPHIKQGITIDAFENVNVYPLIVKILGLPLPAIDGKMEVLEKIYRSAK